jgi:hypothetical protein
MDRQGRVTRATEISVRSSELEGDSAGALSPFKEHAWRALSPAERLRRSFAMRNRLVDPRAVHDQKLFPAP